MDKLNIIKILLGSILSGATYLIGGWDLAIQTLLVCITIDYITGLCKAYMNKTLNSQIGIKGIIKKVGYLCIVAVTVMLDRIIGDTGAIRTTVIYIFVANEMLSIIENWAAMGLPIPKILLEKLEQLKGDK